MPRKQHVPSLRRHKPSGLGVVTLNGKDHYLGRWPAGRREPPPDVRQAYDRLLSDWLENGRRLAAPAEAPPAPTGCAGGLTVAEVIARFWTHAERYYRYPDGRPTNELSDYRYSLRPLNHLYGALPARKFGPRKLKAVRRLMVQGYEHPKYGTQAPLSRGVVNQRVARIARAFRWAVEEQLIPARVWQALSAVRRLQKGRCDAYETEPVRPAPAKDVEAVLPLVLPPVAAMIRLQLHTGMRPGGGLFDAGLRHRPRRARLGLQAPAPQDSPPRQGPFHRDRAEGRARRAGGGDSPPVKVRVRCGGRWHRVILTRSGRLSLPDHTREEVRQGDFPPKGETCRCSHVLLHWRWFIKQGKEGEGEYIPKALRAAAWERRGVARARREPVLPYDVQFLIDLAAGPIRAWPRFLTRVISNVTLGLWGRDLAVSGIVTYSGPRLGHATELMLSLVCWQRGKIFRVRGLQRDWFRTVYRAGLACHEGYLVVKVEKPADHNKGVDFVFYRCRPVPDAHWVNFDQEQVWVARGPAGDFRVVRRRWWYD
jgi:hypothetical protein